MEKRRPGGGSAGQTGGCRGLTAPLQEMLSPPARLRGAFAKPRSPAWEAPRLRPGQAPGRPSPRTAGRRRPQPQPQRETQLVKAPPASLGLARRPAARRPSVPQAGGQRGGARRGGEGRGRGGGAGKTRGRDQRGEREERGGKIRLRDPPVRTKLERVTRGPRPEGGEAVPRPEPTGALPSFSSSPSC